MIKPKLKDVILLMKIVKKIELEELKNIDFKNKTQEEIGEAVLAFLFDNGHKAKDEVLELVSRLTGIKREEIEETDLETIFEKLKEVDISFFTQYKGLMEPSALTSS